MNSVKKREFETSNPETLLKNSLRALQEKNLAKAIQFMKKASKIAPQVPLYHRNLGELLRRSGQVELAIHSHQAALKLEPHSAENHFLLGLTYNDQKAFKLAIAHYHAALSYDQNYGLAWNNLGASLESIGDKSTAKIAYITAIALNPNHAEAQNNLGVIYSEEGQIDKARAHFEAAISANPDFIDAHYNLSLIKTYSPDDPHLAFLEAILPTQKNYPLYSLIRYYFTLGKALDDTKQYERAFKAYEQGNALYHLNHPWDKKKLALLIDQFPRLFPTSIIKAPPATDDRCTIFIVGMPRSGTSLIEQILSSHENIHGAGELSILDHLIQDACQKSSLSFPAWVAQITEVELITLGEKYMDYVWQLAPTKKFIIDKMPGNYFYIGLIYQMLPNAKIIHAIRDPMDSCFSCFTHLFKDQMLFAYDLQTLGEYYILYAKAMQHWLTTLPANTIFDMPYPDLVANPELLSKKLLDYIGLPWDPNCLQFYKNPRAVKTASLTQVRKPLYQSSLERWRHFEKALEPLLQMVAPYRNLKRISA